MPDTTLIQAMSKALEFLGVPIPWFLGAVGGTVGYINTIKALAPTLFSSGWYPVIAAVVALAYSWIGLSGDWVKITAAATGLWLVQWGAWEMAKGAAAAAKLRNK